MECTLRARTVGGSILGRFGSTNEKLAPVASVVNVNNLKG